MAEEFALTEAEKAGLLLERRLTGEYITEIAEAVARTKLAINRLLMSVPEASRKQVADHWYELIDGASKTHAGDPQAFVRAIKPEEFLRVVTRSSAAVTSGTSDDTDTGDDAPDLTDDEATRRVSAVMDAIAALATKFGYRDGFAFLSSGPVNTLSQIADRGGDTPNAITELLRLVLSATNPANPNALQADGTLMVHDMYDRTERERAQLERDWRQFIAALTGISPDLARDRKNAALEAIRGHAHPDVAAKDLEIERLKDELETANRRNEMWEESMRAMFTRIEPVQVTTGRPARPIPARVIVIDGGDGVVVRRDRPFNTAALEHPERIVTPAP